MSSWSEQQTRIYASGQPTGGHFYFEQTARNPRPVKPSRAIVTPWQIPGQYGDGGGPILTQSLPVEVNRVGGIPIYYDTVQAVFYVNGYPSNFTTQAEAEYYARSLLPPEATAPPTPTTDWNKVAVGVSVVGLAILLLGGKGK